MPAKTSTTRRKRRPATPEQREIWKKERYDRCARLRELADASLSALEVGERWRSLLWTAAHHPMRGRVVNLLLLSVQIPGEISYPYGDWRPKGRKIPEGTKAAASIFTSMVRKNDGEDDDGEQGGQFAGFSTGGVFTFGQTEPLPGMDSWEPGPPTPRYVHAVATNTPRVFRMFDAPERDVRPDPDDVRHALGALAEHQHRAEYPDLPVSRAEDESAAHLAALILGLPETGPAPAPYMPLLVDEKDPYAIIKSTAQRVIDRGRQLAHELA